MTCPAQPHTRVSWYDGADWRLDRTDLAVISPTVARSPSVRAAIERMAAWDERVMIAAGRYYVTPFSDRRGVLPRP